MAAPRLFALALAALVAGCPKQPDPAPPAVVRPALPAPTGPDPAPLAAVEPECGPRVPPVEHCVVFTPIGAPKKLAGTLSRAGVESAVEGGRVIAYLDDARIATLLGQPPVYRQVAKSSSDGFTCTAQLEVKKLPRALAPVVRAVTIGHQLCE